MLLEKAPVEAGAACKAGGLQPAPRNPPRRIKKRGESKFSARLK
jgi:hypothetical protein